MRISAETPSEAIGAETWTGQPPATAFAEALKGQFVDQRNAPGLPKDNPLADNVKHAQERVAFEQQRYAYHQDNPNHLWQSGRSDNVGPVDDQLSGVKTVTHDRTHLINSDGYYPYDTAYHQGQYWNVAGDYSSRSEEQAELDPQGLVPSGSKASARRPAPLRVE